MLRNYFKVAFRNMRKHSFFTLVNVLGMTIGVTACLLIIIYVADELSYDQFHEKADRIYTVGLHGKVGDQEIRTANTCPPLAKAMLSEIPEVEMVTRIANFYGPVVKYGDKAIAESKAYSVDSTFFSFFSFKLLEGDPKTALKEPNSVVFTEELAKKYFGDESAVGKLVVIGDTTTYKVTGVSENPPSNSHFVYNMLVSASGNQRLQEEMWLNNFMYTYFILKENGNLANVESKYADLVLKYVGPEIEKYMGMKFEEMGKDGGSYGYFSTKITDLRLHSTTRDGLEPSGNLQYIYFFSAIGILIIIIACINFMNLSTARSAGRAKEVGLRKTLGSLRGQMIRQFLAESMMYSLIAIILAIAVCYILLPFFNTISGKDLSMEALGSPSFFIGAFLLIIIVGVISGSYPAFYLTSFNAVEVLKGKAKAGMKSKGIRSFLVGFQFFLSISLIIFTASIYLQLKFMQERDMGIDRHNVLVVNNAYDLGSNKVAFKNELAGLAQVEEASLVSNTFPGINNTTVFRKQGSDQDHIMGVYFADYEHKEVLHFEMNEGRYFDKEFPTDTAAIVINEAAVREFGFENPIGEKIVFAFGNNGPEELTVVGVFKDFNFETMKEKIRPMSIRLGKDGYSLMVRYDGNPTELIERTEAIWREKAGNMPLAYTFLDENFDKLFRAEQRMSQIFSILSGLAIFVACLGLFALAAFTAEQRTKEIGIRKVMGASVSNLMLLMTREFTVIILIAFVMGSTASWFMVESYLSNFAFRVDISPLLYVGSGVTVILIALLTVSYHSFKAAVANPVKSIRYE